MYFGATMLYTVRLNPKAERNSYLKAKVTYYLAVMVRLRDLTQGENPIFYGKSDGSKWLHRDVPKDRFLSLAVDWCIIESGVNHFWEPHRINATE